MYTMYKDKSVDTLPQIYEGIPFLSYICLPEDVPCSSKVWVEALT